MSKNLPDPDVRILKSAVCPTVSGNSKLTYQIGVRGESELLLRLWSNSGGGMFGKDWVSLQGVHQILTDKTAQQGLTSAAFQPLVGGGANTAGFFVAALRDLGAVVPREGKSRIYDVGDLDAFVAQLQQLVQSAADKATAKAAGAKGRAPATAAKTAPKPAPAPAKKTARPAPRKG